MATTTNTKDYKSANKNYKVTTNQIKKWQQPKTKTEKYWVHG